MAKFKKYAHSEILLLRAFHKLEIKRLQFLAEFSNPES